MASERIRVLVNGAKGRMGQETVRAVEKAEYLVLVGGTDLGDDLAGAIRETKAQVVVDFTQPEAAARNTETILRAGAHPVVGTTGFRQEDIRALTQLASDLSRGGLIAPNFALGAVLLMRFAAEAARYFPAVEVIELHHDQKLDAPSGTALRTVEILRAAQAASVPPNPREKETVARTRGGRYLGVPIHSVRLPGFVAHEEVIFGAPGQVLTQRHDSLSRESFMPGVLLAVRKVVGLKALYYGLESILELSKNW
jgi:4-hydroxy-tetrahydrodipicolinate reductase